MKKSMVLAALFAVILVFTGCAGKDGKSGGNGSDGEKSESSSSGEEDLDLAKYVTLGEYKGLSVKLNDTNVTDEELKEAEEDALASRTTQKEVTGRPVQNGDVVNIDYEGKKDGVAFQGGTAAGRDLEIGSHSFIDGFEDGLIGAEIGETRELNLTFPEQYHSEELAGQDVVFTVTVNSIKENVVPDLTDELAHELDSNVNTVAEYRTKLKEDISKSKGISARSQAYGELLQAAQNNAVISSGEDLPKWLIEENKKSQKESFEKSLQMYGMDLSTYLTQQGMTEKDFDDTLEAYAMTIAEQQLLIRALAEAENITVTDKDIEAQYEEDAATYGYSSGQEFKSSVEEQGAQDTFKEAVLTRKVEEMLFGYAKVENPEMINW